MPLTSLRARVLRVLAPHLSAPFRTAWFQFYKKTLAGQNEPEPRDKQCLELTDQNLGELLGKAFVQRAFPGSSQTDAEALLHGILNAMNADLQALSWMDDATRQRAFAKLSQVAHLIGSPANPESAMAPLFASSVHHARATGAVLGLKGASVRWLTAGGESDPFARRQLPRCSFQVRMRR